ncbi:MAG TPA: LamG domain-containing protein, partial [Flavobacterium sp.]|nr:LamG domain-containing protein [Flavobacterium sp.]
MKKTLLLLSLAFLSTSTFAQSPLYRFDFDGSMDNSGSSSSFSGWTPTGSGAVSYVADRNGVANKAINLPNTINFVAACADLPTGNNARSLSFWVKFINDTDIDTYPVVGWGNNSANQAFGFWRNGPQNSYYTWGVGNDYNVPLTSAQSQTINNGWVHVGMTHNGSQMAIYLNGVAMGPFNRTLNTTGANLYLNRLVNATGGSGAAIYLDDLKIYNTALTAAQMQTLYNPNANVSLPSILSASSSASPTQDSDVITFVVNPGGAQTTTNIIITAFGEGISAVYTGPVFSGNEPTQATYTLTGLAPGTCYSYSIEAINSAGVMTTSGSRAFCTLDANNNSTPVYH